MKIDTKGDAYGMALQHVLTGVYLSELCLIGLFGVRKAPGPTVLMVILLVLTIFYHAILNRVVKPLERALPHALRQEDEEAPLIDGEGSEAHEPGLPKIAPSWVPSTIIEVFERFLLPDSDSQSSLKEWFEDEDASEPQPSEDQLASAYVNPVLTSKTPKLWLVRDDLGVSKKQIQENDSAGITSTDDGAELDAKNNVTWDRRDGGSNVPIFKEGVQY
jgi:calcium permeable stress-gated cation channel